MKALLHNHTFGKNISFTRIPRFSLCCLNRDSSLLPTLAPLVPRDKKRPIATTEFISCPYIQPITDYRNHLPLATMAAAPIDNSPATTTSQAASLLPTRPILALADCIIRPYHESDAPLIAKEANNPLVARYSM